MKLMIECAGARWSAGGLCAVESAAVVHFGERARLIHRHRRSRRRRLAASSLAARRRPSGANPHPRRLSSRRRSSNSSRSERPPTALVGDAHTQEQSHNFGLAAETLERALSIEPRNPLVWIELGRENILAGNPAQAYGMGRKAAVSGAAAMRTRRRVPGN